MGFNFGAFAGGLAQGGMSTYQMLSDIERKDKEMQLREEEAARAKEQFGWSRAEQEEKNKLREAANVYTGVGGANYAPELQRTAGIGPQQAQGLAVNTGVGGDEFDRAANESAQNTLRENAQRQGVAIPVSAEMKPSIYTREQADTDYLKRVAAINPEKALEIEGKQTQTALGRSSLKRVQAEDAFSAWHQKAQEQAYADPVGFLKDNLAAYNNARKGSHLDDGKTAEIVPSSDGKTFSFVQKDSKGKTIGSTPITQETAAEALKHLAFDKYSALPGKFKESVELSNQTRTAKAHERSADAAVSSAGAAWLNAKTNQDSAKFKNGYFEALAKKVGTTKAQEAKEAIEMHADIIQKADPNIPRAAAEQQAANKLLHSAEDKASAVTNKDIKDWLELNGSALKKTVNGRKISMSPEEKQQEAMRVLTEERKKRQGGGGIPTGGGTSAAAILNSAVSGTTKDPFATE
jgi:hypothetical protein